MPYPTVSDPAKSYTAVQQALGDGTFPGTFMDTDIANLRETATNTSEFLQVSHNADGTIKPSAIPALTQFVIDAEVETIAEAAAQAVLDEMWPNEPADVITVASSEELNALIEAQNVPGITYKIPAGSTWALSGQTLSRYSFTLQSTTYDGSGVFGDVILTGGFRLEGNGVYSFKGLSLKPFASATNVIEAVNTHVFLDDTNITWATGASGSAIYAQGSQVFLRCINRDVVIDYSANAGSALVVRFLYGGFGFMSGTSLYKVEVKSGSSGVMIQPSSNNMDMENFNFVGSGKGGGTTLVGAIRASSIRLNRLSGPVGSFGFSACSTGLSLAAQSRAHGSVAAAEKIIFDNCTTAVTYERPEDFSFDPDDLTFEATNTVNIIGSADRMVGAETGVQIVTSNAAFTLDPRVGRKKKIKHTGTLTADRICTLGETPTYLPREGDSFKIARTGGGAFNLNVNVIAGTLKALATNTWAEFVYDGTVWYVEAYGAL